MTSCLRPLLTALSFAAVLIGGPASAQAISAITLTRCDEAAADEAADQAVVDAAVDAFNTGGYAALTAHLPALRTLMAHAPDCYPLIEQRGSDVIIRTDDMDEYLIFTALAAETLGDSNLTTHMTPNTYGLAAMMLGSYAVEMRVYDEAVAWLDRGLALQPDHQLLIMERVVALMALRRFQEVADVLQAALDNPALALTLDRPRYLRSLGIVLIDLERLEEAEAALQESIRLQPDNPAAHGELDYIAQLRAGGEQRELTLTSPAQSNEQTND